MIAELPTSLAVGGMDLPIRWEYRDVLNILSALADPELEEQDKAIAMLAIIYEEPEQIPAEYLQEALEQAKWFIDGGMEAVPKHGPRLMDWEQDFPWIVAPVNRVLGHDIRGAEPLHWWTFLAAYYEIGDCTFAQIVRIRDAQVRGKKLDKEEREWARRNAEIVRLKTRYSDEDDRLLTAWTRGGEVNAR